MIITDRDAGILRALLDGERFGADLPVPTWRRYVKLAEMEHRGLIVGNPEERTDDLPPRRVYRITDIGRAAIDNHDTGN